MLAIIEIFFYDKLAGRRGSMMHPLRFSQITRVKAAYLDEIFSTLELSTEN